MDLHCSKFNYDRLNEPNNIIDWTDVDVIQFDGENLLGQ